VSEPAALVLLVEDEPQMRRFLRAALENHPYRLVEAATGREALAQAASRAPELVLLDLGLPDGDGISVARRLREDSAVPIIVISARGREQDKIAALDAGADDYLTKPFGVGELLARMRVALRHARRKDAGPPAATFCAGDLVVDFEQRRVRRGGEEIHLTPTEYKLLCELVRNAGRVLTHRHLLREVWGINYINQTPYLRVYLAQLRHKLEPDPARPRYLLTETGVGYRFAAE
jgi:two-component system KDP operon response regulator KdpE